MPSERTRRTNISRINCRISVGTAGRPRPRLDFQRQNNRKPARCHRTTVSGRTMASASRACGNRRQTQPRINLSTAKNGIRFGLPRRNTMICCLSTKTSASSAARDRNRSTEIAHPTQDRPILSRLPTGSDLRQGQVTKPLGHRWLRDQSRSRLQTGRVRHVAATPAVYLT
jgi:hypothetical protein